MRTDAVIDKYPVACPNARFSGYSRPRAKFGDIVIWQETTWGEAKYGRVAGRVHHAPAQDDTPEVKDWLLVVALTWNLTGTEERWVNPERVQEAYDPCSYGGKDLAAHMAFFFGSEWLRESPRTLREWAYSGCDTVAKFKAESFRNRNR